MGLVKPQQQHRREHIDSRALKSDYWVKVTREWLRCDRSKDVVGIERRSELPDASHADILVGVHIF